MLFGYIRSVFGEICCFPLFVAVRKEALLMEVWSGMDGSQKMRSEC